MDMQAYAVYNGVTIGFQKYKGTAIISAAETIKALNLSDIKSVRDAMRNKAIPDEEIIKMPISMTKNGYFLTEKGLEAFLTKFAPDKKEDFLEWFRKTSSDIVEINDALCDNKAESETKEKKTDDLYSTDLLEDIMARLKKQEKDISELQGIMIGATGKIITMMMSFEALISRGLSVIAKAEATGPLARTNKEISKELNNIAKEFLGNSISCERYLQQQQVMIQKIIDDVKEEDPDQAHLINKLLSQFKRCEAEEE